MTTTCLISNYNYAAYVGEAVDSALGQSVPFDQIVVVDDGSTDDSFALLTAKYGDHLQVEIVHQENQGQLSCFNAGFSRATGDIIFFLDADDVWLPDFLASQYVHMMREQLDMVYCDALLMGLNSPYRRTFMETAPSKESAESGHPCSSTTGEPWPMVA